MNFSPDDFISINEILADSLRMIDDEKQSLLTPGFYKRQVKNCLKELAFDTFFDERFEDIPMPATLRIKMPSGAWNINDMFIFNQVPNTEDTLTCNPSQSTGCCSVEGMQRVFWKRNYISKGTGYGYTARNHGGNYSDPFIRSFNSEDMFYWFNVQNGIIMFSESCKDWDLFRIVYNGIGTDIDEAKIIPPFAQQAIVLWVAERAAFALKAKNPQKYRLIWSDAKAELYTPRTRVAGSIWDEAVYRLKRPDKKYRDDFSEYLSKMNS
jgi:hypothetical protein